MGPGTALVSTFKSAFRFSGRATRAEFWWSWPILWFFMQMIVLYRSLPLTSADTDTVLTLALCLLAVPMISLGTRRLADAGVWRWLFVLTVIVGTVQQFSYLIAIPSHSAFWMMTFQAERNDVALPMSGYDLRKFLVFLRGDVLPWLGRGLALACLAFALLPSRKDTTRPGIHISEVPQ